MARPDSDSFPSLPTDFDEATRILFGRRKTEPTPSQPNNDKAAPMAEDDGKCKPAH